MTPVEVIDALGNAAALLLRVRIEFEQHRSPQLAGMISHLEQARKHLDLVFNACCDLKP